MRNFGKRELILIILLGLLLHSVIIIIVINKKIIVVFSPKTARTRNTQKDDMFGSQRKKERGQQRHQYKVANNELRNVQYTVLYNCYTTILVRII